MNSIHTFPPCFLNLRLNLPGYPARRHTGLCSSKQSYPHHEMASYLASSLVTTPTILLNFNTVLPSMSIAPTLSLPFKHSEQKNYGFKIAPISATFPANLNSLTLFNDQLDAQFFFVYVYFNSLHVSSIQVLIIRRFNCMNTISGLCHSM